MKKKWVAIMLFSLVLTLSMSLASAADPTANQTVVRDQSSVADHTVNTTKNIEQSDNQQQTAGEPTVKSKAVATTSNKAAGVPSTGTTSAKAAGGTTAKAAGGSSTAVKASASGGSTVSVTDSQIKSAAARVKYFIEKNKRLPNYVTVGSRTISMSQYLKLISQKTLNLYGSSGSLTVNGVSGPKNPSETVKSGNIQKSEYVKLARSILSFMNTNRRTPNYASSSLGKIRYESLVYLFSKLVAFHNDNGRLPNYVSVRSWANQTGGSTTTTIRNMALSITRGKTSTYAKAQAIFNWVRDHVSYSFYYNTKKGALGALSSRSANCCDQAHLVVALARSVGIPARYQYGTCTFSSGTYGHVWAQLYVYGKWYYADTVSVRNSFGVIRNWNLNTYTLHGTYATLPF